VSSRSSRGLQGICIALQNSGKVEPTQKSKVCQNPSDVKVMVILIYDCDGVILTHTVPGQQTVNAQYYYSNLSLGTQQNRKTID
jgi:hypothetical protein